MLHDQDDQCVSYSGSETRFDLQISSLLEILFSAETKYMNLYVRVRPSKGLQQHASYTYCCGIVTPES